MALFNGKQKQEELERLTQENTQLCEKINQLWARNQWLESIAPSENEECDKIYNQISALQATLSSLQAEKAAAEQAAASWKNHVSRLQSDATIAQTELARLQNELALYNDELVFAYDYGLYKPRFDFANSSLYKERLNACRKAQKEHLKFITDMAKNTTWRVNNSLEQGRKMVSETTKLLMRAFNSECDDLVRRVKTSNINNTIASIKKRALAISNSGSVMGISIPDHYVYLKIEEAQLAYEYAIVKEREKEAIREAKAREREEKLVEKEIAAKRKELQKEKEQYKSELARIVGRISAALPEEKIILEEKARELEGNLSEVDKGIKDVDYRAANKRAGFVYVISNIGSFGNDVFKIGMTRRLDPMERIKELGDASVPFAFDVHALIFSNDAPSLETALHQQFENRKVNLVNPRREFFRCTLDEIKQAIVSNYDQTVEFIDIPEAEQFRISEKMRSGTVSNH